MHNFWKELLVISPILIILVFAAIERYKRYLDNKNTLPHKVVCDKLSDYYWGMSAWSAPMDENIQVKEKLEMTVYGEITYEGMRLLAKKLALTKKDVFYDLGSGAGKLVAYMYLATPIKKSVGIEMVGKRHKIALWAKEYLKLDGLLDPKRELNFIHNNIRLEDFSDATVIYMASLCFLDELMEELNQKFAQLKPGLRIISLRVLPKHPRLVFVEEDLLPMTWTRHSLIYHYKLV